MNCDKYQIMIQEYGDNELPKEKEYDMFLHLAECSECREFFKQIRAISSSLKKDEAEVPDSVEKAILETIGAKEAKKTKRFEINIYRTFAYAAALAVMFLSYLLIQKENKEDVYQRRIDQSIMIIDKQSSEIEALLNGLSTITVNSKLENPIVITPKL